MIDAYDVDDSIELVNPVDNAVGATACGVITVQFAGQGLADPMRVVEQRAGKELGNRRRYR